MPYCFFKVMCPISRSHGTKKNINFDPSREFPDCNSRFSALMAMKWCTKLEATSKKCPIVYEGYLSILKVSQDKKLPILTRIERSRTVTSVWIQSWFEMKHKAWYSVEEVPYCFPSSPIKFQGHTRQKVTNFDPNWAFPDCNFSLNSPYDVQSLM